MSETDISAPQAWRSESLRRWLGKAWLWRRHPSYDGMMWQPASEGFAERWPVNDRTADDPPQVQPAIFGKWWQYAGLSAPPEAEQQSK